jgi:DNA uptake protein ComE-like DNA-binding protein
MDLKEQIRVYLSFTKKERTGMFILLGITTMVWSIPLFFRDEEIPEEIIRFTPVVLDSIEHQLVQINQHRSYPYSTGKGRINDSFPRPPTKSIQMTVEVNAADSILFELLPGIGEKLSSRIVRYRERLGGFVSLDQLKEVYGVNDTLFQQIQKHLELKPGRDLEKLSINRADYKELRKHPYISHVVAKILLAYRRTHEKINNADELLAINGLDKKEMEKLLPYLAFD